MTDISALRPGLIVLYEGRPAVVRFVGNTAFADGDWVGLELEDASGKNDGAVRGERYFDCEPERGKFVRPSTISEIMEQPSTLQDPRVNGKSTNGTAVKTRPSSGAMGLGGGPAKRQSILASTAASKRMSTNAGSPTPGARGPAVGSARLNAVRSPTKSPTKPLPSATSSGNSTPGRSTPSSMTRPRPSLGGSNPRLSSNRMSMGPPSAPASANRAHRQSVALASRLSLGPSSRLTSTTSNGQSTRPSVRPSSTTTPVREDASEHNNGQGQAEVQAEEEEAESGPLSLTSAVDESQNGLNRVLSHSPEATRSILSHKSDPRPGLSPTLTQKSVSFVASNKEVDDLKAKLRVLEKKRMEDRDKLKVLEKIQLERDKFEGIIQKLQIKYQPQQQEIADLRKQLKEAEANVDAIERKEAEHESVLEMAALDREMAEETAEALRSELDALKTRAEELELEAEVLREENQELGSVMSPEEKSSQGWLQMERTNERLREALVRLRDLTHQTESDLKSQVKELEGDLEELGSVKKEYEVVSQKFQQSESNVEDLRQQLDTALGAEEMIEELTERNMQYQEQVDNLKATIEDLESLKELNDELEINHVEAEKQLQEEIDYRDSLFSDQSRKVTQQDEVIIDLEYTLSRFRELVTNLQGDLEDMRASQQITETEASDLNTRSKAMMDLNMKLQASAGRAQVTTIDMELRRLEAQEAADQLAMIQLFLPESFASEQDPILTLLRFKRIGFKANLLQGIIRDRFSHPGPGQEEIFAAYDVVEKLAWVSFMCNRFISSIQGCDVEAFAKLEGALYELEPVERGLNVWIDGLRKNELNEKQCGVELQRSTALLSHLAETCMPSNLESYAADIHMRALLIQTYLENTASGLTHLRSLVSSKIAASGDEEEILYLSQRVDSLATQARSSKVVISKAIRSLEELKASSLTLSDEALNSFQESESASRALSTLARRIGEDINALLMEEGRSDPFTYHEIISTMTKATSTFFESSTKDADPVSTFNSELRSLSAQLETLLHLSSDLSKTQEFERRSAPWLLCAQKLKSSSTVSPDTLEELRRLKAELAERSTSIGLRDKTIEEHVIKIEHLESRIREANKRSTLLHDLESQLEVARERERKLSSAIEGQVKELQAVEQDRDNYKRRVKEMPLSTADDATSRQAFPHDHATIIASNKTIESLRLEITGLQATIRFLQDDNQRLRLADPDSSEQNINSWLAEPLVLHKVPREQEKKVLATKAECQDILTSLLHMTKTTKLVELKGSVLTKDGKSSIWRPLKDTPRWQTLKMREEWEGWKDWRNEVVNRERGWEGRVATDADVKNQCAMVGVVQGPKKVHEFSEEKVAIVV